MARPGGGRAPLQFLFLLLPSAHAQFLPASGPARLIPRPPETLHSRPVAQSLSRPVTSGTDNETETAADSCLRPADVQGPELSANANCACEARDQPRLCLCRTVTVTGPPPGPGLWRLHQPEPTFHRHPRVARRGLGVRLLDDRRN
ncbi:hypothetical protein C2E23DRAFT_898192 [Lenzites betulinus]|nr:hypothetical protein C2E23DRAFT_898192 [Lenzites betulinus]